MVAAGCEFAATINELIGIIAVDRTALTITSALLLVFFFGTHEMTFRTQIEDQNAQMQNLLFAGQQ